MPPPTKSVTGLQLVHLFRIICDVKAKTTYLLFQQRKRSDFFGWDKSSSYNLLFMPGGISWDMRRWVALRVYIFQAI